MGKVKFQKKLKKKSSSREKKAVEPPKANDKNAVVSKVKPETTNDTIFIRNLSFETEEDDLKEFFESNFGETIYCLVCRDKDTDESKGTGFVRFKDSEVAVKCLKESRDKELMYKFHLNGRNLIVLSAVSREKVSEFKKKDEIKKDKRNLALAKEGYIHPASDDAKELSKTDLEKRKILDSRKREQLNNLHNFVSETRLCIHNLPPYVDDQKLRQIFIHAIRAEHPSAKIIECKVMRNKNGSGKLGTSKGFGFVAFSKHEHALAALRCLNNNPKTFSAEKRPIIEFSVENMVALNKKKTRLVNSQRKNEALKDKAAKGEAQASTSSKAKKKKRKKKFVGATKVE